MKRQLPGVIDEGVDGQVKIQIYLKDYKSVMVESDKIPESLNVKGQMVWIQVDENSNISIARRRHAIEGEFHKP